MRANKNAAWYEFEQLDSEHGYTLDHPRRNASLTHPEARQRLIIDPGPRILEGKEHRRARFDREGGDVYATTFRPPLKPHAIDTLGELFVETLFPALELHRPFRSLYSRGPAWPVRCGSSTGAEAEGVSRGAFPAWGPRVTTLAIEERR